jgi:plastocyanin
MTKKNLIVLISFVLLLGLAVGVVLLVHGHKSKPHHVSSVVVREAQVQITSSGFSPANITVKSGTLVTWINNDTVSHEVGANPYPSHATLPQFDSGKMPVAPGSSYSYTFTKSGTFGYHDHLNPTLHGQVTVQP